MKKFKNTKAICDEMLAPLLAHCEKKGYGAMSEILALYNKGLAEPILLSTLQRWLCSDPKKRIEPKGGSLLRLLEVWQSLRGKDVENNHQPSIYCAANGCEPTRDGLQCKRCKKSL
jgi:hypothetical protein